MHQRYPMHIQYTCTYIAHANIKHINKFSVSISRFLQQLGHCRKLNSHKMLAIASFQTIKDKILLSILHGFRLKVCKISMSDIINVCTSTMTRTFIYGRANTHLACKTSPSKFGGLKILSRFFTGCIQ